MDSKFTHVKRGLYLDKEIAARYEYFYDRFTAPRLKSGWYAAVKGGVFGPFKSLKDSYTFAHNLVKEGVCPPVEKI